MRCKSIFFYDKETIFPMKKIQMVDLTTQYLNIKQEIDEAILEVVHSGSYINGPAVREFCESLATYTGAEYAIPCANCTDALQIALMSLNCEPGAEVIIPDFCYAAAAEAASLLGLIPVFVDVDPDTFNLDVYKVEEAITPNTCAVIPVHLFGQCCDMAPLLRLCDNHNIYVIEDNAQSIGASYFFSKYERADAGTMGHIGTLSFFPSKNLGCYGDGGAMLTNDEQLAERLSMLASHGQKKKYVHDVVGCNSRLDTLQAAILNVKLNYLDEYIGKRQATADYYRANLSGLEWLQLPVEAPYSTHVYHQFTVKLPPGKRDDFQDYLRNHKIPSMVYYPLALHEQKAFGHGRISGPVNHAKSLTQSVLSLPMHTEFDKEQIDYIIETIQQYE